MGKRTNFLGSAYYLITVDEKVTTRKKKGCLGKLRSQGREYNIFGVGENPNSGSPLSSIRNQYGAVIYNMDGYGIKGQSKMDVLIPKLIGNDDFYQWKPIRASSL